MESRLASNVVVIELSCAGSKGETFVIDTTNILFVLSGAFVGLESIVNQRIGKGVSPSDSVGIQQEPR